MKFLEFRLPQGRQGVGGWERNFFWEFREVCSSPWVRQGGRGMGME